MRSPTRQAAWGAGAVPTAPKLSPRQPNSVDYGENYVPSRPQRPSTANAVTGRGASSACAGGSRHEAAVAGSTSSGTGASTGGGAALASQRQVTASRARLYGEAAPSCSKDLSGADSRGRSAGSGSLSGGGDGMSGGPPRITAEANGAHSNGHRSSHQAPPPPHQHRPGGGGPGRGGADMHAATGAPYAQSCQGGLRPASAGVARPHERPSSAMPLANGGGANATGGGSSKNVPMPAGQRPGAQMIRPSTVAGGVSRDTVADAKMVPTAPGAHELGTGYAHANMVEHTGAATRGMASHHHACQPHLMPRPETAPRATRPAANSAGSIGPASGVSPRGGVGDASIHHDLAARSTPAGGELASQLALLAAHAAVTHGQAPAAGATARGAGSMSAPLTLFDQGGHGEVDHHHHGGGGETDDDLVRQQLLGLALRACRTGGTGVGEGAGMPVGLSELYKLGKAIGEGAFGFVRVAQQRLSRELIAVKTFEKVRA